MKFSKGAVDIITSLLVVTIALGLAVTAYTWGLPLIQKRQDTAVVERISSYFDQNSANSLPSKIEFIANNGGEQTFTIDATGGWLLYTCTQNELASCNPDPTVDITKENNSLQFTFFAKASNIAVQSGFISLTPGASCPPSAGVFGKDKSSVVCAKANATHDGFEITYRIWFREVIEPSGTRGYKIDLNKHESSVYQSTGKTVRISRQAINQVTVGSKTLIIPEIKILLE
ncbi:MAG: hypothetical protein HY361_02765 [Candidatus Aenigmarchaeota archaeon]|nr:hypothetical protein [Candidatus Aenigmarchaeota archaeon]